MFHIHLYTFSKRNPSNNIHPDFFKLVDDQFQFFFDRAVLFSNHQVVNTDPQHFWQHNDNLNRAPRQSSLNSAYVMAYYIEDRRQLGLSYVSLFY